MKNLRLLFFACLFTCFVPVLAYGQATVVQSPVPKFRSFLPNGSPNASGCVYTFASGTSTPQQTFTDFTGLFANSNPVILDGNGEAQIWITSAIYRFQVWSFGSGTVGGNCGNGQQLYQIDGIKDTGLSAAITSLAQVVTINTPVNKPSLSTVTPAGTGQIYNIPDPGTGGNFVINPSGNSGTANVLDCTLPGITCKRTATFYFRGGQCNGTTPALGWDTFGGFAPQALCVTGSNTQKGVMGLPSGYTHVQQNSGTSSAAATITTTYPAATVGGVGDLLVLSVAFNATTTITGCTDGTNAYTQAKHIANGALSVDIWYFLNATTKAAGTTLTCSFSSNATGALKWHEYAAPNTVALDVTASSSGTSNTINTGTTATLAQATELSFAAGGNIAGQGVLVSSSGYTDHGQIVGGVAVADDAGIITQALTAVTANFTTTNAPAWAGAIATFKATNSASANNAIQTIVLPTFYNSAQSINTAIKWMTAAAPVATSTARIGVAIGCVADGATDDALANASIINTVTVSSTGPNLPATTSMSGLNSTGCAAGTTMHYFLFRDRYNAADTYEGYIQIVGAQLQIGITQ